MSDLRIFETKYSDELKQRGVYCKIIIHGESSEIYIDLDEIILLKISEQLDFFFYSGTLEFLDVFSVIETKKITGNEKVTIKIGTCIEETNNFKMKIWNISHEPLSNSNLINKVIKLSLIGEKIEKNVKNHFIFNDKKISDCVQDCINKIGLSPNIHPTIESKLYDKHDKNYILPWVTPQEAIYHLRKYALNNNFNTSDYFIYQNHDNELCFHSLSELRNKDPNEFFTDSIKPEESDDKLNQMIINWKVDIEPGFAFYNSNKTKCSGYDWWHMKYTKSINTFSDNFTKSKLKDNSGGFPILTIDESKENKLLIDYFLYEDSPWCESRSKSDLFFTHYKLLFGNFLTFAKSSRKVGDVIKLQSIQSGDKEDRFRNKLFNGGALIWGITHLIYQSNYIQNITFYKDRYYNASHQLII